MSAETNAYWPPELRQPPPELPPELPPEPEPSPESAKRHPWRDKDFSEISRLTGIPRTLEYGELLDMPDSAVEAVDAGGGYDWLTVNKTARDRIAGFAPRRKIDQLIRQARSEMDKAARQAALENLAREFEANRETLYSEYKIHLQPQRERVFETVARLLEMLEGPNGERLRELVGAFKVLNEPNNSADEQVFPEIVVYVKPGGDVDQSGKTEGRRNLETLLKAISDATADLNTSASDRLPRFSQSATPLASVVQCGGDLKNALDELGLLDKYFDPATDYALRPGEPPIRLSASEGQEEPPN